MNIDERLFLDLLYSRTGHRRMGMSRNLKAQLRHRYRLGSTPRADTIQKYLFKAGVHIPTAAYTEHDLVSLATYIVKVSQHAKALGPAFCVEHWKKEQKKLVASGST